MSPLLQMKLLISLARADGQVSDHEKNFIINIGRANGVYPDQIYPLFTQQESDNDLPETLTPDQKFNYIFSLVQLMKIDERMYKEEIQFCSRVAARLGFSKEVLVELLLHVKAEAMSEEDIKSLKQIVQKFLKP